MVEGTLRSVDPLAYYVNNMEDFDRGIVVAYKRNNGEELKKLAAKGKGDFDIFICVSKSWHGFVLCVPAAVDPVFEEVASDVMKSPFDIPDLILCYVFELCYENEALQTYKIHKRFSLFKDIKGRISKPSYFIGHYKGVSPNAFQIAAMRAAPHRYAVLLDDCVEFSKEFCIQALAYCSNWRDIEKDVNENIKKATASGFSSEQLSRRTKSSGWIGNIALGGTFISSVFSQRNPNATCIIICCSAFVIFVLVYPIVIFYILGCKHV